MLLQLGCSYQLRHNLFQATHTLSVDIIRGWADYMSPDCLLGGSGRACRGGAGDSGQSLLSEGGQLAGPLVGAPIESVVQ